MWVRVTPLLAERLEAERALYDRRPSNAELVTQLCEEGMFFRRMHRSPARPKRPKREPLPPELKALLEL